MMNGWSVWRLSVRYGLMVLWVHDLSDIPIDLLKVPVL